MLRLFRAIALIEGVTTIALFCIAMPVKYWLDNPVLVPPVGMTHGVAWLAYMLAMAICLPGRGFSGADWARCLIAGLFPFGTFLNDPLVRRKQRQLEIA